MSSKYDYVNKVTGCKNTCVCIAATTTTTIVASTTKITTTTSTTVTTTTATTPKIVSSTLDVAVEQPQNVGLCVAGPETEALFQEIKWLVGGVSAHITIEGSLEDATWSTAPEYFVAGAVSETQARGHCLCRCREMRKCKAVRVDYAEDGSAACFFLKVIGPPVATFRSGATFLKFTAEAR